MSFRSSALIVEGLPQHITAQMATEGITSLGEKVANHEVQSSIINTIRNAFIGGRPIVDEHVTIEEVHRSSNNSDDDLSTESNTYPPFKSQV